MMRVAANEWESHESAIISCRRCPRLVAWREEVARVKRRAYREDVYWGQPVPGFGDRGARVLIVGLAPGAHGANRTGRMFTGDSSGDFLYAALHRAGFASQPTSQRRDDGLTLTDAFISAACRCAPPDNRPAPAELAACLPFLAREIALLPRLAVVVALGRIAFEAFLRACPAAAGASPAAALAVPAFAHCAVHPLAAPRGSLPGDQRGADRLTLVTSYHPSRQNTQTGRLSVEEFDAVWTTVRSLLEARG